MKKLTLIFSTISLVALLVKASIIPSGPAPLYLAWDNEPSIDLFKIYGTNDLSIPLNTWPLIGTSTNNQFTATVIPGQMFFYVTASNFWGESGPSNILNLPNTGTNITSIKAHL